jgi:serine/threonine protein phosphatase 1
LKALVRKWLGLEGEAIAITPPKVEAHQRLYSIGDIHGRADLLRDLHAMIEADAAGFEGRRTLVYLGDCIDRGMHSRAVVDELLDSPLPGFEAVYLMGNHEQTLLDFLQHPEVASGWLNWGGRETLLSYGVTVPMKVDRRHVEDLRDALLAVLPERHLAFYQGMQMLYQCGDYLFVHAGIRPGKPLQEQSNEDLLWIRHEFTESRRQHDHVVVHGHTISEDVEFHPNRIGIDTGAYCTGVLSCLVLEGEEQRLLQTGIAA